MAAVKTEVKTKVAKTAARKNGMETTRYNAKALGVYKKVAALHHMPHARQSKRIAAGGLNKPPFAASAGKRLQVGRQHAAFLTHSSSHPLGHS